MAKTFRDQLDAAGIPVRPVNELPEEIRAVQDDFQHNPVRRGISIERLAPQQAYVYEDEKAKITIPVPRVDVFAAFLDELGRLSEDLGYYEAVTVIARAFWLLHQKPKRWQKGWWVPRVDDRKAKDTLAKFSTDTKLIIHSLSPALFGLVEYVIGKKKAENQVGTAE